MKATLQELQVIPNVARLPVISAPNAEAAMLPVATKEALKPPPPLYPSLDNQKSLQELLGAQIWSQYQ